MRTDMPKVLVERPRSGHDFKNFDVNAQRADLRAVAASGAWDRLPFSGPMGPRKGPSKHLNENLAPLVRFLRSRCGQPWEKVYAELRSHLDMRSPIQLHIMEHLFEHVTLRAERRADGRWYSVAWAWPIRTDGRYFYVDPVNGRLMPVQPPRAEPQRPNGDHHRGPDGAVYVRMSGIWWAVTLERLPWAPWHQDAPGEHFDLVLKERAVRANADARSWLYGVEGQFATARRPLNRRELKALGLWRRT